MTDTDSSPPNPWAGVVEWVNSSDPDDVVRADDPTTWPPGYEPFFWHAQQRGNEARIDRIAGPNKRDGAPRLLGEVVCPQCEAVVARIVEVGYGPNSAGPCVESWETISRGRRAFGVVRLRWLDGPPPGRWGTPEEMADHAIVRCVHAHAVELFVGQFRSLVRAYRASGRRQRAPGVQSVV